MHSNFHLMTVNSVALALAGFDSRHERGGVARFDDGEPNGELQEMAAMFPLMRRLGMDLRSLARTEDAMRNFARTAMRVGVTTSTDLMNDLPEEDIARLTSVTGSGDFHCGWCRRSTGSRNPPRSCRQGRGTQAPLDRQARLGAVKLMADGSIQGYTARLKWPGYVTGHPNGIWNTAPDQLKEQIMHLHREGVQMHIHVNGDEASEAALDAIEEAQARFPRLDHRHTLQHCQMADDAQFRRMAALGVCVNLFANHIWYFGDQHYDRTVGPDRAMRMDACASALRHGVPLAIHSDAPVTPMGPLSCRMVRSKPADALWPGAGENQRIPVQAALHAITLGAAYTLKLDHEIGSIEVGKKADFAVLGSDPRAVEPTALCQVPVLGTVMGGRHFPV